MNKGQYLKREVLGLIFAPVIIYAISWVLERMNIIQTSLKESIGTFALILLGANLIVLLFTWKMVFK